MHPARRGSVVCPSCLGITAVLFLAQANANADTCVWSSKEVGTSEDKRFVVTAEFDKAKRQWSAVWYDTDSEKTSSTVLKGIERHAHLTILVPPDGQTFVVLDPSAGHRATDRIQIYYRDGSMIKSYGLKDVLDKVATDGAKTIRKALK